MCQDFIFEYNVEYNFQNEFDKYLNNFSQIIINKVFEHFKIKNISRFGFIIKSEIDGKDKFLQEISSVDDCINIIQ